LFVPLPQRREASVLESLLVETQARAIPQEHLRARATAVREQEEIPGERVGLQLGDD
jgi:hypothetical protein